MLLFDPFFRERSPKRINEYRNLIEKPWPCIRALLGLRVYWFPVEAILKTIIFNPY